MALLLNDKTWKSVVESLLRTLHLKDSDTHSHSRRVAYLSVLLGRRLGIDDKKLEPIEIAALLHDIGKIGIPDNILKKPGKLTAEEYEKMKSHPEYSTYIIQSVPGSDLVGPLILHHQEFIDGRGYPKGLKGENIPFGSRIIMVADAYDAMTSDRVYRKAFSQEKALEELETHAGSQFDARLVEVFTQIVVMFPKAA